MTDETTTAARFAGRYASGETPWDTAAPEPELVRALDAGLLAGRTALEFGCGTGANAVELARRGFEVTAVDLVPQAIETAKSRARDAGVSIDFRVADVLADDFGQAYDVLFDRGAYHCIRKDGVDRFRAFLARVTRPGTQWLCLAGNANENMDGEGPPRVHEREIREEVGDLFDIIDLREVRIGTSQEGFRPLFWAALMRRKG